MFGRKKRREEREAAERAAAALSQATTNAIPDPVRDAGTSPRGTMGVAVPPDVAHMSGGPSQPDGVRNGGTGEPWRAAPAAGPGLAERDGAGQGPVEPAGTTDAATVPATGTDAGSTDGDPRPGERAAIRDGAPRWTPADLTSAAPSPATAAVTPTVLSAPAAVTPTEPSAPAAVTPTAPSAPAGQGLPGVAPSTAKPEGAPAQAPASPAAAGDPVSRETAAPDHSARADQAFSATDVAVPRETSASTASAAAAPRAVTADLGSANGAAGTEPAAASDGAGAHEVSRGTTGSAAPGDEIRTRRQGRPQPLSVADMGAAYPWQENAGTPEESAAATSPGASAATDGARPAEGSESEDGPGNAQSAASPIVTPGAVASGDETPAAPPRETLTSTDAAPAVQDDERGTVADLPARGSVTDLDERPGRSDGTDPEEARRAALVDSLPRPSADTPLLAELQLDARRRIELKGRKFPRPERTRVITVANQKGGVGKTTTTVNLAAALAQAGLQVLVLDNDPQGNASTALGIDHRAGTPSIYEVLVDGAPMHEAVQESPDVPGLWCLPATIDLSGAEIELVSMVARETRLRTALDAYLDWRTTQGLEQIDYVFVDCPPSLGLLTINAFVVAREVLIPIQCEYYALEGLSQLLKTIELIQAHLNPHLSVSTILLTMYDARTNLAQQVAEEVRTHFPERTLRTTVPRSVRISEAPSYGQTVMTYDGGSSGALAYLEAARELAERAAPGAARNDIPAGVPAGSAQEDQ